MGANAGGNFYFDLNTPDLTQSNPPTFDHEKLVDEHGELIKQITDVIAEMAADGDCRAITWLLQSISVVVNGAHEIFPELPACKGCYRAGECGV